MLRTLLLALLVSACSAAPAQSPRYVIFDTHVRNVLAADWDAHASDPIQLERAYCITYQKDLWIIPEYVWRVVEVEPAQSVNVTPHSISYRCPAKPNVTSLHVHPSASCLTNDDCVPGGTLAGQCFPSDTDTRSLHWSGQPFAAILCARDAIIFFLPPP